MKIEKRKITVAIEDASFEFIEPNAKELMDIASTDDLDGRFRKIFNLLTKVDGVQNGKGKINKDKFLELYDAEEIPGRLILKIGNEAAEKILSGGGEEKKIALNGD